MKQLILTWADDGEIYLKVTGEIKFRDCIQAAASFMGHTAAKGKKQGMITDEEIEDFFQQAVSGARYIMKQEEG